MIDIFRTLVAGIDDRGDLQLANFTGYAGAFYNGQPRVQPFGFHSMPPVLSHGIGLAVRGHHGNAVMIGGEYAPARPRNHNTGETTLYDQWGNSIYLTQSVKTIKHTTKIVLMVGLMKVVIQANRIDLGADPAPYAVETVGGTSTKVFAVV